MEIKPENISMHPQKGLEYNSYYQTIKNIPASVCV